MKVLCRGCDSEVVKTEKGYWCEACKHFCCEPYIKKEDETNEIIRS